MQSLLMPACNAQLWLACSEANLLSLQGRALQLQADRKGNGPISQAAAGNAGLVLISLVNLNSHGAKGSLSVVLIS